MTAVDMIFEQVRKLPDQERDELIARLLRALEPDDDEEVADEEWEAAWSTEIARRVDEVRSGRVELVDGDEVLAELRALADRP